MLINLKGQLVSCSTPLVMGIVNITPDSFFDGGSSNTTETAIKLTAKHLEDGATIIDLGAQSTRPTATFLSEQEELDRLKTVLPVLVNTFPEAYFSIDTFSAEVAKFALDLGVAMINDVSGWSIDPRLLEIIKSYRVPYVLTHSRGTPQIMNQLTHYKDVVKDVCFELSTQLQVLKTAGIPDVILDLGFGFAKTIEQNYTLLQNLEVFKTFECPILVGLSRKSMIYKPLNSTPEEVLPATSILNYVAISKGASILRVHDAKEAQQAIQLYSLLNPSSL